MMECPQDERLVSKYIGETEKNIDLISVEEEDADAILLFDEAVAGVMACTVLGSGQAKYLISQGVALNLPSEIDL